MELRFQWDGYGEVSMTDEKQKQQDRAQQQKDPNFRKRTDVPGQNPKANDDPSHTVYNDENRTP